MLIKNLSSLDNLFPEDRCDIIGSIKKMKK